MAAVDMMVVPRPVDAEVLTPEQRALIQTIGHNRFSGPIVLARAKGAWNAPGENKLILRPGDIVKVLDKLEGNKGSKNGWWQGLVFRADSPASKPGIFPFAYVEEIKGLGCEHCRIGLDPLSVDSLPSETWRGLQKEPTLQPTHGCAGSQIIREGHLLKHPFKQEKAPGSVVELVKLSLKSAIDALAPPKRRLFQLIDGGYTHGYSLEWFDDKGGSARPTKRGHLRLLGNYEGWSGSAKCKVTREGDKLTVEVPVMGNGSAQPYELVMKGESAELDGWAKSLHDAIKVVDERLNSLAALRKLMPFFDHDTQGGPGFGDVLRAAVKRCERSGVPLLNALQVGLKAGDPKDQPVPFHVLHPRVADVLGKLDKWGKAVQLYAAGSADHSGLPPLEAALAAAATAAAKVAAPCAECYSPYANFFSDSGWSCFGGCKAPFARVAPEAAAMSAVAAVDAPLMDGAKLNPEGQLRLAHSGVMVGFLRALVATLPLGATSERCRSNGHLLSPLVACRVPLVLQRPHALCALVSQQSRS